MKMASPRPLPPLTSAAVVVGRPYARGKSAVPSEIAAVPHVAALVSDFLDHSTSQCWTIELACYRDYMALLLRLAARAHQATPASVNIDYSTATDAGKGLRAAVQNDNLDLIKWLHAHYPMLDPQFAIYEAITTGKLRLLQWITEHFERVMWNEVYAKWAAANDDLEMLQWIWLHPRSSSFSEHDAIETITYAARKSHLAVIKWLNEHQQWTGANAKDRFADVLTQAVRFEHFQVAKYLIEHGIAQVPAGLVLETPPNSHIFGE